MLHHSKENEKLKNLYRVIVDKHIVSLIELGIDLKDVFFNTDFFMFEIRNDLQFPSLHSDTTKDVLPVKD